ncbi:phage tail tape measure protein [Megasphaera elsdenii]|uniref:Phage tail tape measure protein n=1 Tax=Megasphaera elsdenii TaxID=907 RepID=A0A2S0M4J9_MEGEL|nr:phage tail tape measure protein [Megasphaera elsdenii]AVO26373.1 phage tail tape measure protein [Megasphaera elsdenii]
MASIIDVVMQLTDRVSEPLRRIRSNMEENSRLNRQLGRDVRNVGRGFGSIASTMMPAATAVSAFGALGTKTFMDFEDTITGAGVKAGATGEQLERMKETALKLGHDFPITASEAAEAMDRLAAGGFDAEQTMAAMPGIIEASVASGEDMATTSDVITSALNIWNLKTGDVAENTQHVADVVQMAANVSKLGMADFGLAMQYAGASAAALGVNIEELSTAMAIMSNNGIEASTIGTSLRSTMSRLASPPKEAAAAIDQLGLHLQNADGSFVGITEAISQMREAMDGMTDTQQVGIAKAIAGEDAFSGLLTLIKTSPAAYKEVEDSIKNSTGSSHEAYVKMQNTLKGSINAMKSAVESLAISFGSTLAPSVKTAADAIKSIADFLGGLSPATRSVVANIALSVVGFTAFSFAMSKVLKAGGSMVMMYSRIGNVLKGGRETNLLLRYSVLGVRSAFIQLSSTASKVMGVLRNGMSIGSWRSALTFLRTSGAAGLSKIGSTAVQAGTKVMMMIRSFSMVTMLSGAKNAVLGFGRALLTIGRVGIGAMFSPVGIAIMAIAGAAYILYNHWDKVAPFFTSMWNEIQNAFSVAWQAISPALEGVGNAWSRLVNAFNSQGTTLNRLAHIIEFLASILGGVLIAGIIAAADIFTGVFVSAIEIVSSIVSAAIGVFGGLIDFITGVFTGDWSLAWQGVVEIFSSIFGGIKGICSGVLDGIRAAINAVINGINSISVDIPDWVPGVGGQHFGVNIPTLYTGTSNFSGGPAVINDRFGGEIVDLPSGTRIIPHDQSVQQAYKMGSMSGGFGGDININISNANFANTGDEKREIKRIASEIFFELETRAVNLNTGAI